MKNAHTLLQISFKGIFQCATFEGPNFMKGASSYYFLPFLMRWETFELISHYLFIYLLIYVFHLVTTYRVSDQLS